MLMTVNNIINNIYRSVCAPICIPDHLTKEIALMVIFRYKRNFNAYIQVNYSIFLVNYII